MLYFLLCARPPFRADSLGSLLEAIRRQRPEPPSQFNPAVPPALESICLWCLAKRPSQRPVSAQAVAQELAQWLAQERPAPSGAPSRRQANHQRWRLWALAHRQTLTRLAGGVILSALAVTLVVLAAPWKPGPPPLTPSDRGAPADPGADYGLVLDPNCRDKVLGLRLTAAQLQTTQTLPAWATHWTWDDVNAWSFPAKPGWPGHPNALLLSPRNDWPNRWHQDVEVPRSGIAVLHLNAQARNDCYLAIFIKQRRVWEAQMTANPVNLFLDLRRWAGQRIRLEFAHTSGGAGAPWSYEELYLDQAELLCLQSPPPGLVAPRPIAPSQTNGCGSNGPSKTTKSPSRTPATPASRPSSTATPTCCKPTPSPPTDLASSGKPV